MAQNTTLFSVIAIALIAIIIIGMLVSQTRHKALERKNNKLRMLGLQFKRLQNLLRSLPASYLSIEMRDFLYQALLQNLKQQLDLASDKNDLLKDDYQKITEERDHAKANPPQDADEIMTADQAGICRGLLKSLYQFIQRNYETGRLKKEHADKMLKQVEYKLVETAVEFFTLKAKGFLQEKQFRESRNSYQKAVETIEQSNQVAQFNQQLLKLRNDLENVNNSWHKSREEKSKLASAKLADQMESLADDEEGWKMKQGYDK